MTIGLQLCRWYYQEIGAWKCVSADFVYFHQFFSLFLTYSLSKTLKKWMTLNKVLLVRVIHMTKQFWDKIGRFDADKYAENVLKLECYKSVHAVLCWLTNGDIVILWSIYLFCAPFYLLHNVKLKSHTRYYFSLN